MFTKDRAIARVAANFTFSTLTAFPNERVVRMRIHASRETAYAMAKKPLARPTSDKINWIIRKDRNDARVPYLQWMEIKERERKFEHCNNKMMDPTYRYIQP